MHYSQIFVHLISSDTWWVQSLFHWVRHVHSLKIFDSSFWKCNWTIGLFIYTAIVCESIWSVWLTWSTVQWMYHLVNFDYKRFFFYLEAKAWSWLDSRKHKRIVISACMAQTLTCKLSTHSWIATSPLQRRCMPSGFASFSRPVRSCLTSNSIAFYWHFIGVWYIYEKRHEVILMEGLHCIAET